jgi:DNA-binding NarL/FixJ family response regulator
MEGSTYISDEAATRLISRVVRSQKPAGGVSLLTDREVTVLELIGAGLPARQIAQRLRISPKTVDSHREHIKAKLELKNGAALTRFAVEWVSEQGPA